MLFPTKEKVQRVRERYPIGCRVELIRMGSDPYSKLEPGDQGTVKSVDDTGTVFVSWDCGSGLGMVYGEDYILRIDEEASIGASIALPAGAGHRSKPVNQKKHKNWRF